MILSKFNCKEIFKEAYENRYTWPNKFNGYSGKCIFIENEKSFEGEFILDNTFQPKILNISDNNIVKGISSQLFEVAIHRVKREFSEVHKNNNFGFLAESEKGLLMQVFGKNEGDKYRVKENKINMVFRKIHGVIIEIFVILDLKLLSKINSPSIDFSFSTKIHLPLYPLNLLGHVYLFS